MTDNAVPPGGHRSGRGPRGSGGRRAAGKRSGPPRGRSGPARPPSVDPAREAALDTLAAVREDDAYANLVLPALLRERRITGRDAALATDLAYGACRARGLLDAVLGACCDRDLGALDGVVLDGLRLGAHQLLRTRIPPHAAVAASVDLVRARAGSKPTGFVNAVLRRVAERSEAAWVSELAPDASTDPVGHLAMQHAHPRWIAEVFATALGADRPDGRSEDRPGDRSDGRPGVLSDGRPDGRPGDRSDDRPGDRSDARPDDRPGERSDDQADDTELAAALAADDTRPTVHLAARPGEIRADELAAITGGDETTYSPYGVVLLDGGDPGDLEPVREGLAIVQDEGSQLVALLTARAEPTGSPDERWLDLCAGPGGKAVLLGALAGLQGATLDAVEKAPHRARLVERATEGLAVRVHIGDARALPLPEAAYDRVLVDAPCSGLGALRRRPEARWRRTPDDVTDLTALQRELLATALERVRPGGVVTYATCSPHPAETVDVVRAVAEQAGAEVLDTAALLPEVPDAGAIGGPGVQLWPHRHGTDAMYAAVLRRGR